MAVYHTLPKFREWLIARPHYGPFGAGTAGGRCGDTPAPETVPEHSGAGMLEQVERADAVPAEPDLTPNIDEYLNLKAQHPDKLIGVQVDGYTLFYGKDAEAAAPAMGSKLLTRDIPGLGSIFVTGTSLGWPSALKDLLEHGQSVVIARPDPERGPDSGTRQTTSPWAWS